MSRKSSRSVAIDTHATDKPASDLQTVSGEVFAASPTSGTENDSGYSQAMIR